jgi:hypothetical protein
MPSLEDEGLRTIDKFSGENFNLWKFKLEMRFVSTKFWVY